jgi:peptidoglycan hydrolase-like protein with peptidoglycan-binding domain
MKRLLAATSVCALVLAGAALAQTSTGTGRDTQGMSQGGMSNPGPGGSVSSQGSMQNRGSMSNQSSGSMSSQGSMGSMSEQGTSSGTSHSASRGSHASASSQDVMQAQTELKQMGLYNGQVDGKMGKQTKQALSKFQKQNGLRQTAQLDRQTKDRLMHGGTGGATSGSTSTQGSSMQNSSGSGSMGGSSSTGGTSR